MNVTSLVKALQTKISTATQYTSVYYVSKALEKLKLGNVKSVQTYDDLLAIDAISGDLVFVEDINRMYFKSTEIGPSKWINLIDSTFIAWAWGRNNEGQLGDATTINRSSPVSIIGGINDWIQLSAGGSHSLGLRSNGTLWAWGLNTNGQLGDGTTINKSSPTQVFGFGKNWSKIQNNTQGNISGGIKTDKTVWAWGFNTSGQLGDGTSTNRSSPVRILGTFTDCDMLVMGITHGGLIRSNGSIWMWGRNNEGQLGVADSINRNSPVSVLGYNDWVSLSIGNRHSLAIRGNGTLWAWGAAANGVLGDQSNAINKSSPVSVAGGFTNWAQISTQNEHNVGLLTNGTVYAWGDSANGRLGDNQITVDKSSPSAIQFGNTDFIKVSAGQSYSIGLRSDGSIWGWGLNTSGQLGDATATQQPIPSRTTGTNMWIELHAGGLHSLGLSSE